MTYKKMRRSRHQRVFLGVAGAIADFFGISPFWVRLGFLLAAIPGGIPGVGLYLIGWLIIPKEKE
jgi:phage shock protein C